MSMERERSVHDRPPEPAEAPDAPDVDETGPGFNIDVDRAVGHEIVLDESNWIE